MLQELLPKGIGILGAAFLFGFAIFVHELGHFLVAKWAGVGVKRFAIGFGPVIVAVTRGGTEYSIRWIPLGGFVQLKGMILEDEEPQAPAAAEAKPPEQAEPKMAASGETRGEPAPAAEDRAPREPEPAKPTEPPEPAQPAAAKRANPITEDVDALRNRPPLVRIAVFVAGVTCNYLTAIVCMVILLAYGTPRPADRPNVVDLVPETSKWYALGWRTGDHIVAIRRPPVTVLAPVLDASGEGAMAPQTGRVPIATWSDVARALDAALPQTAHFVTWDWLMRVCGFAPREPEAPPVLRATVERDGRRVELPLPVALLNDAQESVWFSPPHAAYIADIVSASPAARARLVKMDYTPGETIQPFPTWDEMPPMPLQHGDVVLAVNNRPTATGAETMQMLRAEPGKPVDLTVKRTVGKEVHTLLLRAILESDPEHPRQGQLGVLISAPPSRGPREGLPILDALVQAPMQTFLMTDFIVSETAKFLATHSGREIERGLGGPMKIVAMAYESAQEGLDAYLRLFVYISVVLAVMNVLPIPVLDGGYVLITIVEAIVRRPIPTRVLTAILTTFMLLLILGFAWLFYNDFMNIFVKY